LSNPLKYTTSTPTGALRHATLGVGVANGEYDNTWRSGITPYTLTSYYLVYEPDSGGEVRVYAPADAAELIQLAQSKGSSETTEAGALTWLSSNGFYPANKVLDNIVTDGLVLLLDSTTATSYPTSGIDWLDLSGEANDGTLTNSPTFGPNGSITLDGVDDYINQSSFYTSDHFTNNQSFTIDSLINVLSSESAGNTRGGILTNQLYSSQNDPGGFGLNIISQKYCINLTSGSTGNAVSYQSIAATSINYGEIERITAVYDSPSSTVKIYRNGVLTTTQTSTSYKWTPRSTGAAQKIGTSTQGGWTYYFPMDLYNILLYNKALTSTEILQNYYQGPIVTDGLIFAVDAGNLVSYENGSSTVYSLTGSVDGTLGGGAYYSPDRGGMFVFDGNNDYLQFATNPVFERGTTPFTMEAWVELLDNTGTSNISAVTGGGNPLCDNCDGGYFLYFMGSTSRVLNLRFDDSGLGNMDSISHTRSTSFEDGKFHHIVGLRDGTNTKLYLDGEPYSREIHKTITQT
jgi:hypothetical protein